MPHTVHDTNEGENDGSSSTRIQIRSTVESATTITLHYMLTERQCPFPSCGRLYTKKLNHVKLFHQNEAYEFFIDRHISKGLRGGGLCHVCKIAFSDKPEDHVDIKHKDRPFKELAKEKFE